MNVRLFGLAAAMTMAMGVVACGDDETGAGGAGGSGTTGTDATSSGTGNNNTTTSSGGDGGGDATTSSSGGLGGDPGEGGAGGGEGGAPPSDAPCAEACAADPGCADDQGAVEVGEECETCVGEQSDMGAGSACIVEAAFSSECQDDADCMAFIACRQGANPETCDADFPDGLALMRELTYLACGDCGDGAI